MAGRIWRTSAVDLDTGAIVGIGITVHGVDEGNTTTIHGTLPEDAGQLEASAAFTDDRVTVIEKVVADKDSHSRQTALRRSAVSYLCRALNRAWRPSQISSIV
jgi:hypothetical protein